MGFQLGEANRAYGNAENAALQNLLTALGGYQSQYVNSVNGRQMNGTQALMDALDRVLQAYGGSIGGGGGGGGAGAPSNAPAAPTGTDTTSPGAVPTRQPIVGTAVGLPAPNAAALQAGRLARADYTM